MTDASVELCKTWISQAPRRGTSSRQSRPLPRSLGQNGAERAIAPRLWRRAAYLLNEQLMLVDTGNRDPIGRDPGRIAAVAKKAGVTRIDYLLITHYH